jgi:hypothetical protein
MSVYWTTEDLDAGRCGADDLGRARPVDVVLLQRIDHTPEQCVQAALNALVRACEQPRDPAASVKAAALLLDRFLPHVIPQAPQPAPALPEPQEPFPDGMTPEQWLNRFARGAQTPDPALPPTEALIASPEPDTAPSRAISAPGADSKSAPGADLPRLHVVQAEPKFWASPTVPRADN